MRRREFSAFALSLAIWPAAAFSQANSRQRRIGFLATWGAGDTEGTRRQDTLMQKLQELGWIEGKTLEVATRFGDNNSERIRHAAAELIGLAPDVIVSTTSTTTRALMDVGGGIPIVAAVSGDPIALKFTKNLSQPTANVTGFTTFNDTLAAKRLELLHGIVPGMQAVALIWASLNPVLVLLETQTRQAAKAQGVELLSLPVASASDISAALRRARDQNISALIVAPDPLISTNSRAIIDECIAMKMPAMHSFATDAKHGALMSYGIDLLESYRRSAEYVDLILKGKRIADLPFQEPTRLTLALNLKTARAIGLSIPPTVLAVADEVIE